MTYLVMYFGRFFVYGGSRKGSVSALYQQKMKKQYGDEFKNKEGNMTRFTDIPSVLMVNTNLLGG